MAECSRFICDCCEKAVESWSNGNPYFIDDSGQKQHAYHPDQDALAGCVGNDIPYFCLACGKSLKWIPNARMRYVRIADQSIRQKQAILIKSRVRHAKREVSCSIRASLLFPKDPYAFELVFYLCLKWTGIALV